MSLIQIDSATLTETNQKALIRKLQIKLNVALKENAQLIAGEAQSRVLSQRALDRPLPSRLAESITTSVNSEENEAQVRAGGEQAPYAGIVEFGSRTQIAKPYLLPAMQSLRGIIFSNVETAVRNGLGVE